MRDFRFTALINHDKNCFVPHKTVHRGIFNESTHAKKKKNFSYVVEYKKQKRYDTRVHITHWVSVF